MAKKKSRRDELRDGQIAEIQKTIDGYAEKNRQSTEDVRFNEEMISVLEGQITNILAMCEKQDANFKSKKADA